MKTGLTMMGVALVLALGGCAGSDTARDPHELEATEIDSIVSALEDDADGALDDVAGASDLADADGGDTAGPRGGRPGRDGHGPRRGDRRGRGVGPRDLVLWYGDLTALQACRDERNACIASGDTTCHEGARDCIRAVVEDAFTAMCDERTAACAADGATGGACGRIVDRCAAGLPGSRDGGFSHGDGGLRGGRGRGHDGNCDGGDGDDDSDEPTDEPTDAGPANP